MFRLIRLAAVVSICGLLAAVAAPASYAQTATAPAYVVLEFTVKDPDGFKAYAQQAPATFQQYGGKFLVRPGKVVALRGDAPAGPYAVIAFDSLDQARAWASSPEYTAIVPMRDDAADVRAFVVEGVAP